MSQVINGHCKLLFGINITVPVFRNKNLVNFNLPFLFQIEKDQFKILNLCSKTKTKNDKQ